MRIKKKFIYFIVVTSLGKNDEVFVISSWKGCPKSYTLGHPSTKVINNVYFPSASPLENHIGNTSYNYLDLNRNGYFVYPEGHHF